MWIDTSPKGDIQMANKYTKRCSVISETQIKTAVNYYCSLTTIVPIKKNDNTK